MKGAGHIYKRGRIYWLKFYRHGKPVYESSHSDSAAIARTLLRKRLQGQGLASEERLTYEALEQGILEDYELRGYRSLGDLQNVRLKHVRQFFRGQRAVDLTTPRLRHYALTRRKQGAEGATINRELSVIRRMLRIAQQDGRLSQLPQIPMVEESAPREVFITPAEFAAIFSNLAAENRPIVRFLYLSGWRISAGCKLEWRDIADGYVLLRRENSKNKRPQRLPLIGELETLIEEMAKVRSLRTPMVFHYEDGRPFHRSSVSRAFRKASIKAGMRKTIHDLRRAAARDLIRSGVSEDVARRITGHQTRAVFSRYNITADDDLARAQIALAEYREQQPKEATVTVLSPPACDIKIRDVPRRAKKGR